MPVHPHRVCNNKNKIPPNLPISAAYSPPKQKITSWNNTTRNGILLKNHSETGNYYIIHSPTYTYRQPNGSPSNLNLFLTNMPYHHSVQTIDDLFSNHLPVLTVYTKTTKKPHPHHKRTDWLHYRKIINSHPIRQDIQTQEDID